LDAIGTRFGSVVTAIRAVSSEDNAARPRRERLTLMRVFEELLGLG